MFISIKAKSLSKRFGDITIFKNIEFFISTGGSLAVTGRNGSGKSTLLEIISGLRSPTKGNIIYETDSGEINKNVLLQNTGFSSPKVNPYGDLTALENLQFAFRKNDNAEYHDFEERSDYILNEFKLYNDRDKRVKYYSSGMKQRLRFIMATVNDPHVLVLDEPGSNLDIEGKDKIYSYIESVKKEKLIIIATNENEEEDICDDRIILEK